MSIEGGVGMEPIVALDLSLYEWFLSRPARCCKIRVWSATGICLLVNWSLWVQISLADRPRERIRVFRRAVATARSVGEIGSVVALPLALVWLAQLLGSCSGFWLDQVPT